MNKRRVFCAISLLLCIFCAHSSLAQIGLVECYFMEGYNSGLDWNRIVTIRLQSGVEFTTNVGNSIVIPYSKNEGSDISFMINQPKLSGIDGSLYSAGDTWQRLSVSEITNGVSGSKFWKIKPHYLDQSVPFLTMTYGQKSSPINITGCNEDDYICETSNDWISVPAVGGGYKQEIYVDDGSGKWLCFQSDYSGGGISVAKLNDFVKQQNHFGKTIYQQQYKIKTTCCGLDSYEVFIHRYYPLDNVGNLNLSIDKKTLTIENVSQSVEVDVTHKLFQSRISPSQNISTRKQYTLPDYGVYEVSCKENKDRSCPVVYYANIMEVIPNTIKVGGKSADFWSEDQSRSGRNGAILLNCFNDKQPPNINKINNESLSQSAGYIDETIIEEHKSTSGSANSKSTYKYAYRLPNCKPGKNVINITYDDPFFISQSIEYSLDNSFFKNIEVKAIQEQLCSKGKGTLEITNIEKGLENGYRYEVKNNNKTISRSSITEFPVSIPVENGNEVIIMDNEMVGDEGRTERAKVIKVKDLIPIRPEFITEEIVLRCFDETTNMGITISNFSDKLTYEWTLKKEDKSIASGSTKEMEIGIENLKAGNYVMNWAITKDKNSCWSISSNFVIDGPTQPITFTPATRDQSCDESVNGEISFSGTRGGNIGGYQYIISTDEFFSNASSTELLTSSSYVFSGVKGSFQKIYYWTKVSDSKQCESSTSQIVVGVNKYVFENVTRNVTCAEASNGVASISLTQNGNGLFEPNIYKWTVSKNSDNRTSSYATIIEDLGQGRHFFTLASHGCALSNTYDIDVNTYKFQNETRDISCEGATNGAATINIIKTGNGIFSSDLYHWTVTKNPDGLTETSTTQLTELPQGRHFLTVDSYGCELTSSVDVNANIYQFALDTAGASCESISNGKAKAIIQKTNNANGFFTPHYHWTYNGITAEYTNLRKDLHCGDYLLEIKWEGGCQLNKPFTIGHKVLKPTIDTVPAPCAIGETPMGRATLTVANATEPIKFSWDMGTPELGLSSVELPAGTHNVSATDKNGCTVLSDFIIRSGNFDVNATITPALCGNKGDGSVAFALSGGSGEYSAIWDDHPELNMPKISGQSYTQENLPLGIYNVTIFDTDGCAYRKEINMSSGNIKISPSHTLASCAGADDATATIAVVNGKGKIEYQWSDGLVSSEPLRLNLKDGVYKVRVTDEDQCSAEAKVNIRSKTPSVDIAVVGASCGLAPDGTAQAEVFAATFPYTYEWSDNKTTSDGFRSQLDKGDYALTVTDSHGCKISNSFHIPHKGYLTNDIPKHITICTNGEAIIDAHEFLDYQWLHNGKEISDERFLSIGDAGVYIIKARGYDDCYAVDTIDVDISQTELDPYFRMSSVSYLEDTLVVVETSEIKPDKFVWLFDQDIFDLVQTDGQEHELRLIPKQPGFFNITLSAAKENCSADITKPVEILSETRPDSLLSPLYVEKSVIERLNVAPNPTEGPFYVDVALKQTADAMLRIYDINYGVVRAQVSLHGSQTYRHQFNENLPSGMYVVILKVGNEQKMAKVMITK